MAPMIKLVFVVFVYIVASFNVYCITIDLKGRWSINNENNSVNLYGNVPGSVHMTLMENGFIDDPYFRFNDVKYRWIAYDNWTYTKTFNASDELLSRYKVVLVCDGLDTVSTITVNGNIVGQSVNMFMRYVYDIKNALKPGINTIQIKFTSAIHYAAMKSKEYGYDVPPDCSVPVQRGECHRNFVRKEQSSFSWDWGPAFIPQGIWRNISIQGYNRAVIRDVKIKTTRKSEDELDSWLLSVTVILESANKGVEGKLYISIPELNFTKSKEVTLKTNSKEAVHMGSFTFSAEKVESWWPRGYGKQKLYKIKFVFQANNKEQSHFNLKTGFREVQLVQEPIKGATGRSFYFKINTLPIFLKGANWIPADSFEDRVNGTVLRNLLKSAVDANMNVVRNWGGGIYQHDIFYSIADELGLLVWEEFMFACSMYPTNSEFFNNIKQEVIYQIERLNHHPSVFVWSGNNENEIALAENWYKTNPKKSLYVKDYIKLYVDLIQKTVQSQDTGLPFIVSSPSNGVETEREGWVSKLPNSAEWGDVHFYNYTMDCWDVSGYPKPRFASEYGFQSYPSFETLRQVSIEEDWSYDSKFMDHRQHHANGNKEMMDSISKHFKLPMSSNSVDKFKNTLYLTQVAQAMCIKVETEHYRRLQSQLIQGQGKTMGAIYWQLNSIWQSPSWSSLEYGGKWKVLHYFAKDFFSPVISSVYEEKDKLFFFVVSDLRHVIVNGLMKVSIRKWDSFEVLHQWTTKFSIESQSSHLVLSKKVSDMLKESSCPSRFHCVLSISLIDENQKSLGPRNTFLLSSPSQSIGLKNPEIKISNVESTSQGYSFDVSAVSPAPFVWLSPGNIKGRFSENGFLQVESLIRVKFYPWEKTTVKELKQSLSVTSLYNTYS